MQWEEGYVQGVIEIEIEREATKRDREMANQVVRVRREAIAACMTCPLCNKLLRDATTISECLHTCESLLTFLSLFFFSNFVPFSSSFVLNFSNFLFFFAFCSSSDLGCSWFSRFLIWVFLGFASYPLCWLVRLMFLSLCLNNLMVLLFCFISLCFLLVDAKPFGRIDWYKINADGLV